MDINPRESSNWWKTEDFPLLKMSEVGFCIMSWILKYRIDFFASQGWQCVSFKELLTCFIGKVASY